MCSCHLNTGMDQALHGHSLLPLLHPHPHSQQAAWLLLESPGRMRGSEQSSWASSTSTLLSSLSECSQASQLLPSLRLPFIPTTSSWFLHPEVNTKFQIESSTFPDQSSLACATFLQELRYRRAGPGPQLCPLPAWVNCIPTLVLVLLTQN